jgi:hypothetical protein
MMNITPKEDSEQAMLFNWAKMARGKYPELDLMYAIPNGGYRSIKTAKLMKATGVKAGIPDICLPVARHGFHALYIEMKRKKGGALSHEERLWLDYLKSVGYLAVCCKGFEQASFVIKKYLNKEI